MTTLLAPTSIDDLDDSATRRQFLAGLAAAGLLAGCGSAEPPTPAAPSSGAFPVRIEHMYGTTEIPAEPTRVVSASVRDHDFLLALGVVPVGVRDWYGDHPFDTWPWATNRASTNFPELLGFVFDAASLDEIKAIAPIVGISHVGKPFDQVLARWVELAAALGADLNAPQVVRDREPFDDAAAALAAATAAKPGLEAMFVAGTSDTLYVVHPRADRPVWLYDEAGLDVVVPNVAVADYWEALSWEQVGRHPVDLIFHSVRTGSLSRVRLLAQPTFAALPATRAGQLAPGGSTRRSATAATPRSSRRSPPP